MTQVAEGHGALVAGFEQFRAEPAFGPEWLRTARASAFARFLDQGFPTTRDEEWKFTNVAPIAQVEWRRASTSRGGAVAPAAAGAIEVVIANGRPDLSGCEGLPAGLSIRSLQAASAEQALVSGPSLTADHPFVALNTAFFEDGLLIEVAPKAVIEPVIVLRFVTVAGAAPVMVSPRLRVIVGEQAQVSIIERYEGDGTGVTLTNAVSEFQLEPAAVVDHVKVQQELPAAFHLASTFVHLERSATFVSQAVTFGGRIARNDITATLAGEGAEATLNGLYVADGDTLVDTHTCIDHATPHCPSHEVYKGILAGQARAVFNGKIIVRPDAQKTDAKQTNKALLLSDDATINTKPQLEIFADDVKCTHGAAIGQLDADQMFYLRARGIAEADARNILIHAFASDVLNGVRHEALRVELEAALVAKLHLPE